MADRWDMGYSHATYNTARRLIQLLETLNTQLAFGAEPEEQSATRNRIAPTKRFLDDWLVCRTQ